MKQWFYKVFTLTVVGMVVYLIFSKDDSLYYHFPWELFAGIGIMSGHAASRSKPIITRSTKLQPQEAYGSIGYLRAHETHCPE